MTWPCGYCGRATTVGGWTDDSGVGWMPNCWGPDCEEFADRDAERQRDAMKKHNAIVGKLVDPAD